MAENTLLNYIVNYIATGCSIVGFIISVVTLVYASSIKKAVKKTETKAVFNALSTNVLEELRLLNYEFSVKLGTNDEQEIKNILNKLKIKIVILLRFIPGDYTDNCIKVKSKLESQYKGSIIFNNNPSFQWTLWKEKIKTKDLWDTYNLITEIIDYTDNYKQEKNIIS